MKKPWKVDVIESERGWGQSLIKTERFHTYEEAEGFMTDFNSSEETLGQDEVPDYYIKALPPVKEGT
ncbi:MAG: hypothetical protein GY906_24595 [bacterium]|nr:hypothetical protein [bacterium]